MKKLFTLLLLVTVSALSAQDFDKKKLDSYLQALADNNKAMLSAALLKDGKPIYQKSVGYASINEKQQPDANTQYRIGSITKVFTTTLIFQLIEEEKISLDTKLSDFYPKVKNAEKISISMLLSHRSGIHNLTNDSEYMTYMTKPMAKSAMVKRIEALGSDFEPGSQADYSNSAFILLGFIIEDITGTDYQTQLEKRITSKLGLSKTRYGEKIDTSKNQAFSYNYDGSNWTPDSETDMSIPHGAGAIISTPTEVGKFLTGLFTEKLISKESVELMKELRDGYGRGLFRMPFYKSIGFGHSGGIDAFSSQSAYFESEGLAMVITSNGMNFTMNDIVIVLLSAYFNRPYNIPDFSSKPTTLSAAQMAKYEGVYATDAMPLKITVKVANGALTAQATGQGAFPLTAYSTSEFRFDQAGIVMMFDDTDYTSFILKQGGNNITFTKE